MKNNLIMIAFFCIALCFVVTGRCQYREQQEIERVGKGHTAQNVIGACGYHIGNAAFFLSGRFLFESLESGRLFGCRERIRLLLIVFDTDYPVQNAFRRLAIGLGIGNDSLVGQYI